MAPFLPAELWYHILTHCADTDEDSCALWISARRVSKQWRSTIAKVFANTILRDPTRCLLRFDTDTSIDLEMVFSHFVDDDRSRCVFKFKEQDDTANVPSYMTDQEKLEYVREKYSAVSRSIQRYIGDGGSNRRFDLTPHILCIDGRYMDSDLPQLSVASDCREISFDWEGIFLNFFSEVTILSRRDLAEARRIGARFQEDSEFLEDYENIANLMDAVEGARLDNLRDARRRRIERYYGGPQELDHEDAKWAMVEEKHRLQRIRSVNESFSQSRVHGQDSASDI